MMGLAKLKLSARLVKLVFKQGITMVKFTIDKGLPEGAELVDASYDVLGSNLVLFFEHDSFENGDIISPVVTTFGDVLCLFFIT